VNQYFCHLRIPLRFSCKRSGQTDGSRNLSGLYQLVTEDIQA
jgi:hypothetical protein